MGSTLSTAAMAVKDAVTTAITTLRDFIADISPFKRDPKEGLESQSDEPTPQSRPASFADDPVGWVAELPIRAIRYVFPSVRISPAAVRTLSLANLVAQAVAALSGSDFALWGLALSAGCHASGWFRSAILDRFERNENVSWVALMGSYLGQ